MIFQDPFASLNPRMRVADIVGEAPLVHGLVRKGRARRLPRRRCCARCGLDPSYKRRYPHQFSGGQRSRIGIARALAVKPEFLVCDEAVAALDVSIQAQILNLFMDAAAQDLALTYLFISHDLGVVEHLSDRVVIMYLGRVVESASAEELFRAPNHPYTQALLQAGAAARHAQDPVQADRRRDPLAARPAHRLPLPPALPARHAALQGAGAAAEGSRAPATSRPATSTIVSSSSRAAWRFSFSQSPRMRRAETAPRIAPGHRGRRSPAPRSRIRARLPWARRPWRPRPLAIW